jgi:hypothetical protein
MHLLENIFPFYRQVNRSDFDYRWGVTGAKYDGTDTSYDKTKWDSP